MLKEGCGARRTVALILVFSKKAIHEPAQRNAVWGTKLRTLSLLDEKDARRRGTWLSWTARTQRQDGTQTQTEPHAGTQLLDFERTAENKKWSSHHTCFFLGECTHAPHVP